MVSSQGKDDEEMYWYHLLSVAGLLTESKRNHMVANFVISASLSKELMEYPIMITLWFTAVVDENGVTGHFFYIHLQQNANTTWHLSVFPACRCDQV